MREERPGVFAALRAFCRANARRLSLLLAMAAGGLLPGASVLSFLIPYLIAFMLYLSFLDLAIDRRLFHWEAVTVLLASLAIAFSGYFLLLPVDPDLAVVAFLTGVTPTAIASPVFIGFIDGRVEKMVTPVLLTNVFMALLLPFVLPVVAATQGPISTWVVLRSVLLVVIVPLLLTRVSAWLPETGRAILRKGKSISFYLWAAALFLISSKAASYLLHDLRVPAALLLQIALVTLVVCTVNFCVGALLGGRNHRREISQALGQKNCSLTIWLALTFINPLIALGPTFYIVYQNVYNSLQLIAYERRRALEKRNGGSTRVSTVGAAPRRDAGEREGV